LRRRPAKVEYVWTWAPRPHVDPKKESDAEEAGLRNRTVSFSGALAARGKNLDTHIRTLQRVEKMLRESGITLPDWLTGAPAAAAEPDLEAELAEQDEEKVNATP
jgi:capsid protein